MPGIRLHSVASWKQEVGEQKGIVSVTNHLTAVYEAKTISQRFDALCGLVQQCDRVLNERKENVSVENLRNTAQQFAMAIVDAKDNEDLHKKIVDTMANKVKNPSYVSVENLRNTAQQFAMAIVDAKDNEDLYKKIVDRMANKVKNPSYMPWPRPGKMPASKYSESSPLQKKFDAEKKVDSHDEKESKRDNPLRKFRNTVLSVVNSSRFVVPTVAENKVIMLDQHQREQYRIFPSSGLLKNIKTNPEGCLVLENVQTSTSGTKKPMFVISLQGDMFMGHAQNVSVLAGAPALFAGRIRTDHGALEYLDDESNQYDSRAPQNIRSLAYLRKCSLLDSLPEYHAHSLIPVENSGYHKFFNKPIVNKIASIEDDFEVTDEAHDRILNALNMYIALRTTTNEKLDFITAQVRNVEMSQEKLDIVLAILELVKPTKNLKKIMVLIRDLETDNHRIEKKYQKKYSSLTSSDIANVAHNLRAILRGEKFVKEYETRRQLKMKA